MMNRLAMIAAAVAVLSLHAAAPAQVIFSDNFDVDTSANWNTNISTNNPTGSKATYAFDYSTVGIPSAPNSVGGTTRGLKLEANTITTAGVVSGLSVSPKNVSATGNYTLRSTRG
jgi:hypothetical protein